MTDDEDDRPPILSADEQHLRRQLGARALRVIGDDGLPVGEAAAVMAAVSVYCRHMGEGELPATKMNDALTRMIASAAMLVKVSR